MAKKTYVVAEGMAFTAMGHIFGAGEEIPEGAFSDKVYMAKMISEKKIIEAKKTAEASAEETLVEETIEASAEEVLAEETVETLTEEVPAEEPATKRSTAKGGK